MNTTIALTATRAGFQSRRCVPCTQTSARIFCLVAVCRAHSHEDEAFPPLPSLIRMCAQRTRQPAMAEEAGGRKSRSSLRLVAAFCEGSSDERVNFPSPIAALREHSKREGSSDERGSFPLTRCCAPRAQ